MQKRSVAVGVMILLTLLGHGWAQSIPAKDLQADFVVLKRAYETLHPGLLRYNTVEQLAAHFEFLRKELDHDQSLAEAYLAFSRFTAKLKCGHTYPNFFNQPKAVAKALFDNQPLVPFAFKWIDRRMIVTRSWADTPEIVPGTEILAINGVKCDAILDQLMTIARADGSNDAKRISYLQVLGNEKYEAFDIYFPLFFPPKSNETFDVQLVNSTVSVQSLRRGQRGTRSAPADASGQPWRFEVDTAGVASLTMPTWALFNTKWDWAAFIHRCFKEMSDANAKTLVIDLRGNEGGLDCGNVIISHLIERELRLEGSQRCVRYQRVPEDLAPYLDTWDDSFKDWGEFAKGPADAEGFYRLTKFDDEAGADVIKPIDSGALRFAGPVFVIVDASNSSATFQFAQLIQQAKLGTLVGQPTGGNQRGINGGAFFFLRLPNTKIELDLPLVGSFPKDYQTRPDAGITPDVMVPVTQQDIAAGVDAEMAAIRKRL